MSAAVRVARRAQKEFRYTLSPRQRSTFVASASFAATVLGARTASTAIRGCRVQVFHDVIVGGIHLYHYRPGIGPLLVNLRDVYWTREGRWAFRVCQALIGTAGACYAAIPLWRGVYDQLRGTERR